MGLSNLLGKNGIFIADESREKLKISLDQEQFRLLKDVVNKEHDPEEIKKCFLTGNYVKVKDGLFIDREWMAKSVQESLDKQEMLWDKFKTNNEIVCGKCGTVTQYNKYNNIINCPKCNMEINAKKYGKTIKLPLLRKVSMKLYIKYLKGDTSY